MVGSRDFRDVASVRDWIRALARKHPSGVVVSGGARGVDRAAESAAKRAGLSVLSFRPYSYEAMSGQTEFSIETETHGDAAQEIAVARHSRINPPHFKSYAAAAHHRNGWIVDTCQHLAAFWDGRSRGTLDSIRRADKAGKLAVVLPRECAVIAEIVLRLDGKPVA